MSSACAWAPRPNVVMNKQATAVFRRSLMIRSRNFGSIAVIFFSERKQIASRSVSNSKNSVGGFSPCQRSTKPPAAWRNSTSSVDFMFVIFSNSRNHSWCLGDFLNFLAWRIHTALPIKASAIRPAAKCHNPFGKERTNGSVR